MGAKKKIKVRVSLTICGQNYLQQCMRAALLLTSHVWNTEHATSGTLNSEHTHSPLPRHTRHDTKARSSSIVPEEPGEKRRKNPTHRPTPSAKPQPVPSVRPSPHRREPPPRRSSAHRSWSPSSLRSARPRPLQAAAAVIR